MRKAWRVAPAIALLILFAATPRIAAAQDAARAFIANLGGQAIQVLGPAVPPGQRLARFREIFRNDFDVPGIGQFVLGRYWRSAAPQEQQEFLRLFQEYIVQAYSARLAPYGGAPFQVTGSRPNGDEIVVNSQVARPNAQPVQIDWYLINFGGQFRVADVYVGGISMKVTQRDEFASIIQHDAGQIAGLIARLREKTALAQQ